MGLSEEEDGELNRIEAELSREDPQLALTLEVLQAQMRAHRSLSPFQVATWVTVVAGLVVIVIGAVIGNVVTVVAGAAVAICAAGAAAACGPFNRHR
ncbi:DUF3040 domain-containing protein [Streptomyces sp. NPDC004690]